ncbi:MAG: LLM class flavin-dependent oxidoreductase [Promethearchaeota archaeon]
MKWGIALNVRDTVSKTVDKAIIADKGGIEQVWITDFPAIHYAPSVAAAVAERTNKARIGVGLVSPLLYTSAHIIQFMTTLIESHGNRFDLLLGPGDRLALQRIGITSISKTVVEKNRTTLREVKRALVETSPECRVLLGAQGPKMIEISCDADGVLLNYSDLEMAKWAVDQIGDKISGAFDVGLFPPAFIGTCKSFSGNLAISFSAAMVALGLGESVADLFNLSSSLKDARTLLRKRGKIDNDVVAALGNDLLKRFAFCGTQKQLCEYVKDLEKIGYTSVVFGPPVGISRKSVEELVAAKSAE